MTIIVPYQYYHRQTDADTILSQLDLYELHYIAAAAHSIFYSTGEGITGNRNLEFWDEIWDYALPAGYYEYGSDFEKMVLSNEHHLREYALGLVNHYRNVIYNAVIRHFQFYNWVAMQGARVFPGSTYALIVFGNHNHEFFDRYCVPPASSIPIGADCRSKCTFHDRPDTSPYHLTTKRN